MGESIPKPLYILCICHTACSNGDAVLQADTGDVSELCYNGVYHRVTANAPPTYASTMDTNNCGRNRGNRDRQSCTNTVYVLGVLLGILMPVFVCFVLIVLVYWTIAKRKMDSAQMRHNNISLTGSVAEHIIYYILSAEYIH